MGISGQSLTPTSLLLDESFDSDSSSTVDWIEMDDDPPNGGDFDYGLNRLSGLRPRRGISMGTTALSRSWPPDLSQPAAEWTPMLLGPKRKLSIDLQMPIPSALNEERMYKLFGDGPRRFLPDFIFRSRAHAHLHALFRNRRSSSSHDSSPGPIAPKRKRRKGHVKKLVSNVVLDWLFLALLGTSMALCSIVIDYAIDVFGTWHVRWLNEVSRHDGDLRAILIRYAIWVGYAVVLTVGSALFVHFVSPQAIGSGIPEMKTVLRGVYLKEYLSFRTLISKVVGLMLSLGSGMPIGKEGPFVHVASVVANLLSRVVNSFDSVYVNESRHTEMLAAGCAVGVACVFSAPVGGVLFSIEVTSAYFAVRNYWRGFFAAAWAATVFRLLRVLLTVDLTVVAFYQTWFPKEAFLPEEMPIFCIIGLICGFASAAFIALHRRMVLFLRSNALMKKLFQQHWIVYPIVVSFLISSLTFPDGYGMFIGGQRKFSLTARDFFMNCTWSAPVNTTQHCPPNSLINWLGRGYDLNVFMVLSLFTVTYFFLTALASTIPIPSGCFGPSFTLGAAFGRLIGEVVATIYPDGIRSDVLQVYPGVYAVVGAAAFCGGVTHTVSVAVIVFELTGQLVYILPVMIAVLIANAVCSYLQPSIYDSIIQIKHLPYLPDIPHSSSNFHGIKVEQFMTSAMRFLTPRTTYAELQQILYEESHLKALPVVESEANMILLGSCNRSKLIESLERKVGDETRRMVARKKISDSFDEMERRFRTDSKRSRGLDDISDEETQQSNNDLEAAEIGAAKTLPLERKPLDYFYHSNSPVHLGVPTLQRHSSELPPKTNRFTVTQVIDNDSDNENHLPKRTDLPPVREKRAISEGHTIDELSPAAVSAVSAAKSERRGLQAIFSQQTVTSLRRTLSRWGSTLPRRSEAADLDLHGEDRLRWEIEQLSEDIDLADIGVDPAPFQLVGNTSLLKVHSLFSLLGLNRAYVTKCGRLVGIVALRDIRIAIEGVTSGQLSASTPAIYPNDSQTDPEEQIRLRSQSIAIAKMVEDARNDRLNPQLEVVTRQTTWASFKDVADALSAGEECDRAENNFRKRVSLGSVPCLAIGRPSFRADSDDGTKHRRWQSIGSGQAMQMSGPQPPPPIIQVPMSPTVAEEEDSAEEEDEEENLSSESHSSETTITSSATLANDRKAD